MPSYFVVALANKENVSFVIETVDITPQNYSQLSYQLQITVCKIVKERNNIECQPHQVQIVNISRL